MLDCLLGILLEGPLPIPSPTTWPVIDAVLGHASDSWLSGSMRQLSLGEMAAAASVSPGHLNCVFRAHLGSSPAATIEHIRLARAERLLVRSSMSLTGIAEATGFADRYHLSRRFRRCFGVPPATYRRAAMGRDVPLPPDIIGVLPLVDRVSDAGSASRGDPRAMGRT